MSSAYDVVVIGAGANGLCAAAFLARAGRRVLVVDGAHAVGQRTSLDEFAPGFRAAPLALDSGWLAPAVASAVAVTPPLMVVPQHAVAVATGAGGGDGFLAIPTDAARAREEIARYSERDARVWERFVRELRAYAGVLERLYTEPAPDVATVAPGELVALLRTGLAARSLDTGARSRGGAASVSDLLRVLPMPVQDLLDDEFESAVLKAAVGAGGVRDLRQGPRSGGTTFNLLHWLTGAPPGSVRARGWWQGGPSAFKDVVESAARRAGATVRTQAHVARILVRDDEVAGVVLDDAEEIFAPVVLSTADPATTLLSLVDPVWLDPEVIRSVRNIKFRGATAFVLYALDRLPDIPGLDGIVSLSASLDDIERAYDAAKHGGVAETPHVELTATSLRWPSHAPDGKHVLVARVAFLGDDVGREPDTGFAARLGDIVTRRIEAHVPAFASWVLHRAVRTPGDIAARHGVTDGAVTHGELTLDQVMFMRPVPGWARYAMPIRGLYLGGAGAHPGPGVVGSAGVLAARAVLRAGS